MILIAILMSAAPAPAGVDMNIVIASGDTRKITRVVNQPAPIKKRKPLVLAYLEKHK